MNESRFGMYFPDITLAKIKDAFAIVVPAEEIREKATMGGEEITVENVLLELYVYSSDHGPGSSVSSSRRCDGNCTDYLGNGEYFGSMEEMQVFLNMLGEAFASRGIIYEFEYYEETPDGEQVGDSHTMRHPDFDSPQTPAARADES